MIENVLTAKKYSLKIKISIKTLISALLIAMAVALPQLFHIATGVSGGVKWLPMYLPVLIAGCLLGTYWGLGIGILSPLVSFAITSLLGNPMPVAARLPFMMAELAVFAAVSGLFSDKILQHKWLAFPAVWLAQIAGRCVFLALVAVFQSITTFTVAQIWSQIKTGFVGLGVQAVIVPLIVIGVAFILERDSKHE